MHSQLAPQALSNDDLLRRVFALVRQSRATEADIVAHLAEVDARRLFAREACSSMFAYCTERLHFSEAEAYLRIAAARASRQHPVLLAMLAEGRLHLSAIERLAPHLTPENRDAVLARAVHRTKRQVEELVADLAPRPDAPALVRRLPARVSQAAGPQTQTTAHPQTQTTAGPQARDAAASVGAAAGSRAGLELPGSAERAGGQASAPGGAISRNQLGSLSGVSGRSYGADRGAERSAVATELRPDGVAAAARPAVAAELRLDGVAPAARPAVAAELRLDGVGEAARPTPVNRALVEPTAPGRYKVQFTAGSELREKLERLQALMRRTIPDADLASVIEQAVSEKLERLEAVRYATVKRPRVAVPAAQALAAAGRTAPKTSARRIPAAIRRAVYARDGGRCRYTDRQGRRCTARHDLEFHHRHPFGHGGAHTVANLCLACPAHTRMLGESDYGRLGPPVPVAAPRSSLIP